MTKVDGTTNVYSYTFTGSYTIVAFTEASQSNYGNFWQTKAVYREDFGTSTPMYTPETTVSGTYNGGATPYYNTGTWSTYGSAGGGTTLPTVQLRGALTDWDQGTAFVAADDGLTASITLSLAANTTYEFKIYMDGWYGNTGTMTSDNCTGWTFSNTEGSNAKIKTASAGEYTFVWTYATKKLSVTYPVSCTTPTIAWSTAPAGGTAGGSMTAAVSTNQTSPTVTWTSSNTGVATVDANGNIAYVAAGTATITASYTGDGSTYCAEKVSVSKEITVTAAATALNIYVQGRFKVRTAKGGSDWLYTGDASGSWNTSSNSIKFEYEEATGYYKLNTYCSVTEYSAKAPNNEGYYFHFKEGSTEYGATEDNVKPALEANKRTIQSGSKNFIFTTTDCTEGDNVVLYLDWSNKKFWYAVDVSTTYTVIFHANGHGSRPDSQDVESGKTASVPTPPTAEGYTFGGWYTESSCTNAYNFDTPVTADLDLYAKWTKDYSTASYYYYDEQSSWADSNCKELTKTAEYAYVSLPKSVLSNNKFKIFDGNNKSSWGSAENDHLVANAANISESLKGNIALADAGDGYKNINYSTTSISTSTFYVILYYPNTSLNASSTYVIAASTILPGGETPKDTYWYFDDTHTGWTGTIDAKWKLVDAGDYAYVAVTAYSGTNNKFKIFPTNPKDDNNVYANGDNIATDELAGNIMLTAEGGNYNNIKIESTCDDYYVVLYYPGTTLNAGATPLVAAMYDLPGTTAYNVSFGVVDEMGGTITAKYGCSTITSGQLVTRATFTATPETGYVVEGWYSDEAGTTRIDAAGTSTTYTQTISAANNTVYVKFGKAYAIYYKFNDQKWNNDYYAYIFTDEVWHSDNGVQPKVNRSEYGKMSKYNDSVYYYKFTKSADYPRFAFSWGDHSNDDYFNNIDAVYRTDFHKDMPVFIAERGQSASVTKGKYYSKGVWMKFNDTDPGYELGIRNQSTGEMPYYRFTAEKAGDYISTVTLNLVAGTTYSFLVKNDKAYYFKITDPTTCTSSNHHFELYVHDTGGNEVVITPTVSGAYTFQLNLANGKVEIDVIYPTTEYRLIYVEKSGSTFVKFHPSHTIAVHDAGCDTVSLHVRPNVKDAAGTESANPNTCEVWLQQFVTNAAGTGMEWRTLQQLDVKNTATITGNGVYNFVLEQNGGITMPVEKIHLYTGNYFIRSDASKAGWDFASAQDNLQNRFWYSDYARQHETFDYYCCHWTTNGTNLNFVVANAYSYCITDTLVQNTYEADHNYVDATGNLLNSANIRFMWNSYDNSTDRAYLAGAGDNLFLLSQKGIYDLNGTQQTSLKFADQQNWVYRLDIKSDPNAFIKIKAPYAGYTQYFKGSEAEYSFQLIKGLAGKTYNIRVIYDFKTNHLICAWLPEGEITDNESIETDMMIIRQNQGDARQLTFNPTDRAVGEVKNVYCVLTLTKEYLSADTINANEKKFYWLSFPFDVRLSEVFGCGVYSNDYVIQYYDGAERAAKGCWADSPTYWRYYWDPTDVILKKGMGYVLYIDWEQILAQQFTHGNTEVSIYFPSANTEPMDISGKLETVEIPEYKCTIERCDRYIYDSNWNIIGVPAYANIDQFGNPMIAKQIEGAAHGLTVGFVYVYQPATYSYYVAACQDTTFRSMQAYMVQFGGTINWQEKSVTGEVVPSQRMMRAATPDEEADRHTLRLALQNAAAQQVDHTYIRTQETNVTAAFDLNYDLTKQFSSGANVYSLVGENRITLAANVLPMTDAQQGVSIGVTLPTDGVYTLALPDGTDDLNVVLYDRTLGTYTDLSLAGYTFEAAAGTLDTRFELIVKSPSVTTQMTDATAPYVVYVDNGIVRLEGVETGTTVRLFDAVGRLVWTRLADGNLEIPAMAAGTYLLQIGNAIEKIVIQ